MALYTLCTYAFCVFGIILKLQDINNASFKLN